MRWEIRGTKRGDKFKSIGRFDREEGEVPGEHVLDNKDILSTGCREREWSKIVNGDSGERCLGDRGALNSSVPITGFVLVAGKATLHIKAHISMDSGPPVLGEDAVKSLR